MYTVRKYAHDNLLEYRYPSPKTRKLLPYRPHRAEQSLDMRSGMLLNRRKELNVTFWQVDHSGKATRWRGE